MDPHALFDILSAFGLLAGAWVGLAIKNVLGKMENTQASVKADLVQRQTDMARDLTAKHAENRQDIAVHSARDEEQFKTINDTLRLQNVALARIEKKIDNGHTS